MVRANPKIPVMSRLWKSKSNLCFALLSISMLLFPLFSHADNLFSTLSKEEQHWIIDHPSIRVASEQDWHPFDYVEYDKPKGMVIDYIRLVAEKAGLKIEFINGYSWDELLELFKKRQIDVMPTLYYNEERSKFTLYTKPYYRAKLGIMVRNDSTLTMPDLYKAKVGIQKSNGSIKIVEQQMPQLEMVKIPYNIDLVTQLATNNLDAIIGNPYVFYYHAKEEQISDIKLLDYIEMDSSQQLNTSFHIGVRNDWPVLHSILQKAMDDITEEEFASIEKKWVSVRVGKAIDWILIGQIVFVILLVLLFLFWNNKKLKRMVNNKTLELRTLNDSLETRVKERTNELLDMQQGLEQKELQQRNSMASASHELRTPIATIMAKIEAMRDGIRPLDQDQLTSLSLTVEHLASLVEDLYLLSLADVNALIYEKERLCLDEIVHEALAAAQNKLSNKELSILTNITAKVLVNGDARRLRQIIDNLLENCSRYTASSGEIIVTVRQDGLWAELTVADTGPGVDNESLSKLFDRFYRVDQSRSRQDGGTGLGLSLVKALAEAHGGHVKAYHTPEGGLGVSVKLPLLNN